eukprot:gene9758-13127_t
MNTPNYKNFAHNSADENDDENNSINSDSENVDNFSSYRLNLKFNYRLNYLEYVTSYYQYQLACLSTLGGAYHLTNKPKVALLLAKKQEITGWKLGACSIVIRSKVFQAINFGLLNKINRKNESFQQAKYLATKSNNEELLQFINTSENWLKEELKLKDKNKSKYNNDNNNISPNSQLVINP